MPNAGLHLLCAQQMLARWASGSPTPPFPLDDARAVAAFVYGSLAPDAGYFPPFDRLYSELAHVHRSGDLVRAMLEEAADPVQRAHAWGWAAHVVVDLAIHPLVNRAHGEWRYGDGERAVTSTEDEIGHMRLEAGIDVALLVRHPGLEAVSLGNCPDEGCLAHVGRAYLRVHGWSPDPRWLASAHRRTGRLTRLARFTGSVHAAGASRPGRALLRFALSPFAPPRRWLPARWNRSSVAHAVLSPRLPADSLLAEIESSIARVPARLQALQDDGFRLDNHDLVTGLAEAGTPTPRAAAALRELERRRAAGPRQ